MWAKNVVFSDTKEREDDSKRQVTIKVQPGQKEKKAKKKQNTDKEHSSVISSVSSSMLQGYRSS